MAALRDRIRLIRAFGEIARKNDQVKEWIDDEKREVRAMLNSPVSDDRRIIQSDLDGYTERIALPATIEDRLDAADWFTENEYIEYHDRGYDCTGQLFTSWYRLFHVNGAWVCYHRVSADV